MEEEEEEEEEDNEDEKEQEEEKTHKQQPNIDVSGASSSAVLLPDCQAISEGLINPAFSQDDNPTVSQAKSSIHRKRSMKSPRLTCLSRDRPYGYCRSLSSSMENMTFSGAPLSPTRGSFPSLNESMNRESLHGGRSFTDDTSLRCSRSKGIT